MSTDLSTRPGHADATTGDDLDHLYCCDENRGLCGTDLTEVEVDEVDDDDGLCVVCADLEPMSCEVTCRAP